MYTKPNLTSFNNHYEMHLEGTGTLTAASRKNAVSANINQNRYFHKHTISGQSIFMAKGCMDIYFDMVDTALQLSKSSDRLLISSEILQGRRK